MRSRRNALLSFLFQDANFFFTVAIGIVLVFALIEILGMLFGLSLMAFLDNLSPIDVDADLEAGGVSGVLSWLCMDRLPLMIWLILLLTSFGLSGYLLNYAWLSFFGSYAATLISHPVALLLALLITGRVGGFIARMLPKNESTAVDTESFSGTVAIITVGTASQGSPAEAKAIDEFEQAHYLMVEPMSDDQFHQGDKVILVEKGPRSWLATRYE